MPDAHHLEAGPEQGRPAKAAGLIDDGDPVQPGAVVDEGGPKEGQSVRRPDRVAEHHGHPAGETVDDHPLEPRRLEDQLVTTELERQEGAVAIAGRDRRRPRADHGVRLGLGHRGEHPQGPEDHRQAGEQEQEGEQAAAARHVEHLVAHRVAHPQRGGRARRGVRERTQGPGPGPGAGDEEEGLGQGRQGREDQEATGHPSPSVPRLHSIAPAVRQQDAQDSADHDNPDRVLEGNGLLEERHRQGGDREPPGQPLAAMQADCHGGQPDPREHPDQRIGIGHVEWDEGQDPHQRTATGQQGVGERGQGGKRQQEGRQRRDQMLDRRP